MFRIRFNVVLIVSILIIFFASTAHSQEKPHERFFNVQNITLFSADGLVRLMDAQSTHNLLSNSCKCFKEDDPLAPATGNRAVLIPFQLGVSSAVVLGSYLLHRSGHHRLERILPSADITMEAFTVRHNYAQHVSTSQPNPPAQHFIPFQ